ncbi:hypothetical protein T05_6423 [Trichinella murrelli]|uniref:Uncharacterized protein n=1 Tax=Trichinella murrelli TaxID=144512 RepID=A0A0V0TMT2_9BILA|nr:hypothetical protein T05_6423 [Trichinella murrelli]
MSSKDDVVVIQNRNFKEHINLLKNLTVEFQHAESVNNRELKTFQLNNHATADHDNKAKQPVKQVTCHSSETKFLTSPNLDTT